MIEIYVFVIYMNLLVMYDYLWLRKCVCIDLLLGLYDNEK